MGQDESRGRGRPEKACDLLIDYGWAWVCLEVVSGRLTQQSVARGSGRDFDKDVNKLVEDKLEQGGPSLAELLRDKQTANLRLASLDGERIAGQAGGDIPRR